ncbi:hypothetical protein BC629DRAFT_1589313 [Irpex lacteus]|nr:hypothetical protein BC629DRAFT_1589313 [Irpex lacteus]
MYPVPMNYPDRQARERLDAQGPVEPERPRQQARERRGSETDETSSPGIKERVAGTFQQIAGRVLGDTSMVEHGKQRKHHTAPPSDESREINDKDPKAEPGSRPGMRDVNSKGPLYQSASYVARV